MIEKNITTTSDIVQDISNELIFGHTHNGVKCAVCPTAKRACDRAWFSAKQIENWSGMSTTTLWRRLNDLEECERISRFSDLKNVDFQTETGSVKTTLYNLNVLNQLAMVEMKNKVLNDTAKKFSDILSEVETTGSYSIRKPDSYMIEDKIERAKRWIEETEEWQKALSLEETAHAETKALLAEEREKVEALNDAVDNLERTKSWINDKKVASALGTAGAKSKESEEAYMTARDWCFKHQLPIYSTELKGKVSRQLTIICMACPDREQWHVNNHYDRLFPKWACDVLDKAFDDDMFLLEYRPF